MLPAGAQLPPYEIVSLLGAGGMGEVYRARDTRLGRDVALKVLPAGLSHDTSRRQRFELEARAVAALNHPNIAAVYDVGEADGQFFIVCELVDGETLKGAQTGLRKTLDLAAQIASGLAAAHDAGIVHRDLKPENILLTRDGRVKILDFGLARIAGHPSASEAGQTETIGTEPGMVMGTVGYMSPEQVRGVPADPRSDIFNLGLILHELLSGRRAFHGDTSVETMTAILKQDAPELPETVPAWVRQIVGRCLEKDPANRFQSAKDLAFALSQNTSQSGPARAVAVRGSWRRWIALPLAGAGLGLAAGFLLFRTTEPPSWSATRLGGPEVAWNPRLSPDGHTVAMETLVDGESQIAVMRPEAGDWAVLTHERNLGNSNILSWSVDGSRVFYDRYNEVPKGIYSVPVLGGEPRLVVENACYPEMLPDGSLLLARFNSRSELQVFRFWPDTGRFQDFPIQVPDEVAIQPFRVFPGGREAVVVGEPIPASVGQTGWRLFVLDLATGHTRPLPAGAIASVGTAAVTHDGRNVFFADDATGVRSISTAGKSPARILFPATGFIFGIDVGPDGSVFLNQTDRPADLVRLAGGHVEGVAQSTSFYFDLLPDGRAVWGEAIAGRTRLIAVDPGKVPTPLIATSEETAPPVTLAGPGLLAFLVGPAGKQEIAIASLVTGRILRRIPFDKGSPYEIHCSPDGKTLYCVAKHAVWAVPTAGGAPVRIHDGDSAAIDPDGKYLAVITRNVVSTKLYKVPLNGDAHREIPLTGVERPTPYLGPRAISRDGRLLVGLASADSWFYHPGIVDLTTGRITLVPADFLGDYFSLNWTADGGIMAIAVPMRSSIWKFTPQHR